MTTYSDADVVEISTVAKCLVCGQAMWVRKSRSDSKRTTWKCDCGNEAVTPTYMCLVRRIEKLERRDTCKHLSAVPESERACKMLDGEHDCPPDADENCTIPAPVPTCAKTDRFTKEEIERITSGMTPLGTPGYHHLEVRRLCKEMCEVDVGAAGKIVCHDHLCHLLQSGMRLDAEVFFRSGDSTNRAMWCFLFRLERLIGRADEEREVCAKKRLASSGSKRAAMSRELAWRIGEIRSARNARDCLVMELDYAWGMGRSDDEVE